MPLVLRPLAPRDEEAALAAHEDLAAEGFEFLWAYDPASSWRDYLARVADYAAGRDIPQGHVPAALLVADVDGALVGRISIRFELNDFLRARGGHIGYAVRRAFRRRGHATEILRQGLVIAHAHGIEPVLVTCQDENVASAAVIERCAGRLESVFRETDGSLFRRYWIQGAG